MNSWDWEIAVLLQRWSHEGGGPITEIFDWGSTIIYSGYLTTDTT